MFEGIKMGGEELLKEVLERLSAVEVRIDGLERTLKDTLRRLETQNGRLWQLSQCEGRLSGRMSMLLFVIGATISAVIGAVARLLVR